MKHPDISCFHKRFLWKRDVTQWWQKGSCQPQQRLAHQ